MNGMVATARPILRWKRVYSAGVRCVRPELHCPTCGSRVFVQDSLLDTIELFCIGCGTHWWPRIWWRSGRD